MIPASPQAGSPWAACEVLEAGWREPVEAAAPFADEPYALALLSGGAETARWSYLMRRPERVIEIALNGTEQKAFEKSVASVNALVEACKKIAPKLA